jgi:hypothetical protein
LNAVHELSDVFRICDIAKKVEMGQLLLADQPVIFIAFGEAENCLA